MMSSLQDIYWEINGFIIMGKTKNLQSQETGKYDKTM